VATCQFNKLIRAALDRDALSRDEACFVQPQDVGAKSQSLRATLRRTQ